MQCTYRNLGAGVFQSEGGHSVAQPSRSCCLLGFLSSPRLNESPATFSIQESSLSDSSNSPHLISESGTGGLVCFFFDCGDFFLVGGVLDAAGVDFLGGRFRCSELFFSFFDRGSWVDGRLDSRESSSSSESSSSLDISLRVWTLDRLSKGVMPYFLQTSVYWFFLYKLWLRRLDVPRKHFSNGPFPGP